MAIKPIPAFYCCYLLRSTVRHSALYVGSTPNPRRRLAQHNGDAQGGAVRTSRKTLRPWEITCIVTGFPSNIAALQFEWSWQNSHLTRRINDEHRITIRETTVKVSKTGRVRRRPARPRMSLPDKLRNLHLLLRVPSFARWPLQLRFFSADVYASWLKWTKQSTNSNQSGPEIILDFEQPEGLPRVGGGVQNLPVNYLSLKSHLQKTLSILAEGRTLDCSVCRGNIDASAASIVTCPEGCSAASHIKCLASKFIKDEGFGNMIPTTGHCPDCNANLQWINLVRETTLRMRGPKEIAKLMKPPRKRKAEDAEVSVSDSVSEEGRFANIDEFNEEDTDDDGDINVADVVDEPLIDEGSYRLGSDDDDMMSVTSAASEPSRLSRPASPEKPMGQVSRLSVVIEDSDWDDADVLN